MKYAVARRNVVLFCIDPFACHVVVDGIAGIKQGKVDVVGLPERVSDAAQSRYFQCAGIAVVIKLIEMCALCRHGSDVGIFQNLVFVADTYRGE